MWEYEYSVETTAAPEITADFPEVLAALAKLAEG
jgi:hypothetical protein